MIFDSGVFDVDGFDDVAPFYQLDTILRALKSETCEIDTNIIRTKSVTCQLAMRIGQPMALYSMDAIFVLDRNDPRFQESIINAMLWSYARLFEELSEAIATMGLRLTLPNATIEDLELYWSRILGIKRRHTESDSAFRMRLITRLAILSSSGTIPEIQAIVNKVLEMEDACRLEPYWPAELRVNWTSQEACKKAQANYTAVKEALDAAIAAGVSWSTAFPYKEYQVDMEISGLHSWQYRLDMCLPSNRYIQYLMRMDLFDRRSTILDVDVNIENTFRYNHWLKMNLVARNIKQYQQDLLLQTQRATDFRMDQILLKRLTKPQQIDLIAAAQRINYYRVDVLSEKAKAGYYRVAMELVAA